MSMQYTRNYFALSSGVLIALEEITSIHFNLVDDRVVSLSNQKEFKITEEDFELLKRNIYIVNINSLNPPRDPIVFERKV